MNLSPDQWNTILTQAPLVALLAGLLWAGSRPVPWWVFGAVHRDAIKERDFYKEIAFRALTNSEKATSLAHVALIQTVPPPDPAKE